MAKAEFSESLIQFSVSHYPPEIIELMLKKIYYHINVENSCAA